MPINTNPTTNNTITTTSKYPREVQAPRYRGTGFTNTESVLNANQGSVGGMQQSLMSNLAQQRQQQAAQLGANDLSFRQAQNAGNYGSQQNLSNISSTLNNLGSSFNPNSGKAIDTSKWESLFSTANKAKQNPASSTFNTGDTDYSKIGQAVTEAKAVAAPQINYQPILSQTFGNPQYGQGASELDKALLNQNSGTTKALKGAIGGLEKQAEQTQAGAQAYGQQVAQEKAAFAPKYQAITDAASANINTRADAARAKARELSQGGISQQELPAYTELLKNLGYNQNDVQSFANKQNATGGVGSETFLSSLGTTGAASAQQKAHADAIAKLTGGTQQYSGGSQDFTYTQPSLSDLGQQIYSKKVGELGNYLNQYKGETATSRQMRQDYVKSELDKLAQAYGINPNDIIANNNWIANGLWVPQGQLWQSQANEGGSNFLGKYNPGKAWENIKPWLSGDAHNEDGKK